MYIAVVHVKLNPAQNTQALISSHKSLIVLLLVLLLLLLLLLLLSLLLRKRF